MHHQSAVTATIVAFPVGTIAAYALPTTNLPSGWLLCDGSTFDRSVYPALYQLLGNKNTLPDLRGYFLRGLDTTGKVDPDGSGRTLQSVQGDSVAKHSHRYTRLAKYQSEFQDGKTFVVAKSQFDLDDFSTTAGTTVEGAAETRPKNFAVNYLIFAGIPATPSGFASGEAIGAISTVEGQELTRPKATVTATMIVPPIGTVAAHILPATNLPLGWLLCDGSAFDQTQYPEFYRLLGEKNILPDFRGYFLRGLDPTGRVDPDGAGRALQSMQQDAFIKHSHRYTRLLYYANEYQGGDTFINPAQINLPIYQDNFSTTEATTEEGVAETRPKNFAVNYLIFAGFPPIPPEFRSSTVVRAEIEEL